MSAIPAGGVDTVASAIPMVKLAGVGVAVGVANSIGLVDVGRCTFRTFKYL